MTTSVDAVYENGVLKLKEPMDLADGTPVEVIVIAKPATQPTPAAPTRTPAEILAEIAAMPREGSDEVETASRDHDT